MNINQWHDGYKNLELYIGIENVMQTLLVGFAQHFPITIVMLIYCTKSNMVDGFIYFTHMPLFLLLLLLLLLLYNTIREFSDFKHLLSLMLATIQYSGSIKQHRTNSINFQVVRMSSQKCSSVEYNVLKVCSGRDCLSRFIRSIFYFIHIMRFLPSLTVSFHFGFSIKNACSLLDILYR